LLDELSVAESDDLRRTLKRLLARFEHPDHMDPDIESSGI
jgi:hypothetical protein